MRAYHPHDVIKSATPADSSKNVESLTSSKNSWQKFFISIKPIRMIAAIIISTRLAHGNCAGLTLRVVAITKTIGQSSSNSDNVLQSSTQRDTCNLCSKVSHYQSSLSSQIAHIGDKADSEHGSSCFLGQLTPKKQPAV